MRLPRNSTAIVFWWAGLEAEYAQSPIKDVSGVIKKVLEFLFICAPNHDIATCSEKKDGYVYQRELGGIP